MTNADPTTESASMFDGVTAADHAALRGAVVYVEGEPMGFDLVKIDAWLAGRVGAALREAGAKVAQTRHTISRRRVANAEWLGEMVHAMGNEVEYQTERRRKRTTAPGSTTGGA